MDLRRGLRCALIALALLLAFGSAQALAAPRWLDSESQNDDFPEFVAPDVATDAEGNSVAVWLDQNGVGATYRPRGGPWQADVTDLEPDFALITSVAPRVVARPDGTFVAVWDADRGEDPVLRSATRSTDGTWTTEDVRDLNSTPIDGLEAAGDGSVTVVSQDEGSAVSNTKPAGGGPWGPTQNIGLGPVDDFAAGPDGSAVAIARGSCSEQPCVGAAFRPPGGDWSGAETVSSTVGKSVTGLAVTANPSGYSAVWSELTQLSGPAGIPGDVVSSDRTAGPGGSWGDRSTVVDLPVDLPGCDFGCVDVATGPGGAQIAAWRQSGQNGNQIVAALRSGPGAAWGAPQTAGDPRGGGDGPFAALTATGIPVLTWSSSGDNTNIADASHRDAAGVWRPVQLGTTQDDSVYLQGVATDGDGNALTAFKNRSGVFTAGFDGAAPRFTAFTLPSGSLGAAPFSAAANDAWSPVSIGWTFGDGAGAPGASVTHAYGAAGIFTATATATDAVGNAATESGTVTVTAEPTPTPSPDPCGTGDKDKDGIKDTCDTSDGSSRPVAFKTVNAKVVSGEVFVKLPAGAARAAQAKPPKGFVRLTGAQTIPVGSTIDTAKGRVSLRTASDTRKHVQTAQFFRGRFLVRQVRKPRGKAKKRSTKLITELRLSGSSFSKTCKAKASIAAKKRSKKRVRRLFGDGKGSFRTRGRNAAATVRGTRWGVQDRCDGTLVAVQRGRVEVRDFVKRKTVIVRAGKTYLARRR